LGGHHHAGVQGALGDERQVERRGAEGALDACVMMSNKPWDTAAGTLIAREAGARLTDAQGNPHTHKSASTVVAAPGIAEQLATVIRNTEVPSDQYAAAVG
ncbi:inositol monophosphatase family protein, partial [Mycobacterium avium]